jgi:phage repressor protein C with HTH and peptisase S24 domain
MLSSIAKSAYKCGKIARVRQMPDSADMADMDDRTAEKRRDQLRRFMAAHQLKARPWALAAGLKSDGTIRNFLKGITRTLTQHTVERLARAAKVPVSTIFPDALLGEDGAPTAADPHTNAGGKGTVASRNGTALSFLPDRRPTLARDLPIRGHTKAGKEGFFIDQGETWGFAMRPETLRGVAEAYAVRVHDESMSPRYEPGTVLLVDPFRQPKPGDNVVIQLSDGQAFVKVLVRRGGGIVACSQFNPKKTIEYKQARVASIHLVVGVDYLER